MKSFFGFVLFMSLSFGALADTDWRQLANNLVSEYKGRIVSIEQLTSSTCWVVVLGSTTGAEALEIANSVGIYIRNVTGGLKGDRPTVRVFRNDKHLAVAKPSFSNYFYDVEIDMKNWGTDSFKGKYRP